MSNKPNGKNNKYAAEITHLRAESAAWKKDADDAREAYADLRAEAEKLRQERDALRDLVSGERREAEGGIEFCGLCGGYHPLGNKSFVGRIFDNPCAREEKGGA